MVKKTGLGKGLGALLPVSEDESGKAYFTCPIEKIRPHAGQPRKTFSDAKLAELAASIREKGVIQPLVVRKKGEHYELIAGERRWRAAQAAGLHELPVVIQDVSEESALEMALIENIQREDLNAIEEAEAYQALMERAGISQEEMAKRVGKERSTVSNALRLLKLPVDLKRDIAEGRLAMGHARALLALESAEQMKGARDEILKRQLSVRETEALVKRLKAGAPKKPKAPRHDPELVALTDRLRRHFQARVAIRANGKGGRIEIAYADTRELSRLVELLGM